MQSVTGAYFDTVNTITADCADGVLEEAMKLCEIFHNRLGKNTGGSDVYRINHAGGRGVAVDGSTAEILNCSKEFYERTEGLFNISIEPLARLWDIKNRKQPPKDVEIQKALAHIDLRLLECGSGKAVLPLGMQLDLGGIAKGYIADAVAGFLKDKGVKHALLDFGGNIVAISGKDDDTPWKVGLKRPFASRTQDFFAVTELSGGTIVTSGIYERFFVYEGKIYHHILNPKTGYPADTDIVSVTVKGTNSMMADAVATSVLLMGWEKGRPFAEKLGYQVLGVLKNGGIAKSEDFCIMLA